MMYSHMRNCASLGKHHEIIYMSTYSVRLSSDKHCVRLWWVDFSLWRVSCESGKRSIVFRTIQNERPSDPNNSETKFELQQISLPKFFLMIKINWRGVVWCAMRIRCICCFIYMHLFHIHLAFHFLHFCFVSVFFFLFEFYVCFCHCIFALIN